MSSSWLSSSKLSAAGGALVTGRPRWRAINRPTTYSTWTLSSGSNASGVMVRIWFWLRSLGGLLLARGLAVRRSLWRHLHYPQALADAPERVGADRLDLVARDAPVGRVGAVNMRLQVTAINRPPRLLTGS